MHPCATQHAVTVLIVIRSEQNVKNGGFERPNYICKTWHLVVDDLSEGRAESIDQNGRIPMLDNRAQSEDKSKTLRKPDREIIEILLGGIPSNRTR